MRIESSILDSFQTISLEEMEKVRLMNRVDSKFVTDIERISVLLSEMRSNYLLQQINGMTDMPYSTCYFDTEDYDMYYQHQRGKKIRQKVRMRLYEGSMDLPFLEIKHKNNKGRTKKKRVLMEDGNELIKYAEFLEKNSFYRSEILYPQIENHFYRLTLVNKELTERITIDTRLEFNNLTTNTSKQLLKLGIIEWKRDGQNCKSELEYKLRNLQIHQSGFSKYCIGMAITNPNLPQNRLKPKIRLIEKILSQKV